MMIRSATRIACLAALLAATAVRAADESDGPRGAAVTVLKATKSCFSATVEVAGLILPREEFAVRPDRPGLKVTDVSVEPGETVNAGQTMARLALPEGGNALVQAPVTGVVSSSTAVIGSPASAKGEALFNIISRSEFELVGMVPVRDLAKLSVNQAARVRVLGAGELDGRVRRVAATVEPNSQLGQVFVTITASRRLLVNSSARAIIKTGESCGIAVPLTAVLYGPAGTVVQVVKRDRVETRRVEIGLMASGQVEIREGLTDGDIVVARAGALLREGDAVRPIMTAADAK
jgi:multidrug efflux pump subunit AcrA (membrane-fusion protein)